MNLTPEQQSLLLALPQCRKHATSIGALAHQLDRDPRAIRDDIKFLRECCNVAVVALPTKRGVWIAESPAELEQLIACQQSRLDSLSRSISRLKRVRDEMSYQPALF
jgi:hypothetical protein